MTGLAEGEAEHGRRLQQHVIRQTCTASVDLLGLANSLASMDRIVDEGLESAAAIKLAKESLDEIRAFRATLGDLRTRPTDFQPSGVSPIALERWKHDSTYDLRITWFSDCALMNVLVDPKNVSGTCRGVLDLALHLATATLLIAADGQLLRGGIEMGVAVEYGEQEVLGSGLVHAYRLESSVAGYPRIVVGPRMMGFLQAVEGMKHLDPIQLKMCKYQASIIREFIVTDSDGINRINFMARRLFSLDSSKPLKLLVQDARRQCQERFGKLNPLTEVDLFKKYSWMYNALGG